MSNVTESILIVDDNQANLKLLRRLLLEHGYLVRVATNGTMALESVQAETPTLILLDIRMPGFSGYEVCERLKAGENTKDIPIIFLSALKDPFDKVKAFSSGGVDYLTKPFEAEEVLARVQNHLNLSRLQQELRQMNEALEQKVAERTAVLVETNARLETEIAERKRAEAEVRTLNAELEQRVRERTIELEVANKDLRDFAYVVSHDLKAPLRGIHWLVTCFVKDYSNAFDDEGRENVELLNNRVKRMDTMIDGILRYSRVGRAHSQKNPIDLNPLVTEIIETIAPPDSFQFAVADDLPCIVADRTRITQIFQNLLSNAIKYMDKPEGRITVDCVDEDTHWKFSVADNGPGIESKHYETVFQIFQTLTSRDEHESTGIGLSIVKKIVEMYEGKIWVESTVGEGCTFFFTFPK